MSPAPDNMEQQRLRMVAKQLENRGIRDRGVLDAMRQVPRERFVAERYEEFAYDDGPLPIPEGQTISQPYVVALMIQALRLTPDDHVLEVGTGSGYAAAVISRIVSEVYTVERFELLGDFARQNLTGAGYDNVHVLVGDGTLGWLKYAPYNAIIIAAGGPGVPDALKTQLVVGGRLVIPVGSEQRAQRLVRVTRLGDDQYDEETFGHVRFVPLIGKQGWDKEERRWSDIF